MLTALGIYCLFILLFWIAALTLPSFHVPKEARIGAAIGLALTALPAFGRVFDWW